jgi:glyoxylase-like metal-dependent hydrolase (beta-lactamase superfamily II)
MEMKQISESCYAIMNEKNRVCDANSGFINRGGGVLVDTQSDLAHAQQMINMLSKVWSEMPKRVIITHEDGDHVWGNQLFPGAEFIAHQSVPERMKHVANPAETQHLLQGVANETSRMAIQQVHPGVVALGQQLLEDYNLDGIELVMPTTVFDTRYNFDLAGMDVQLIYVGPCHSAGDTIVHVPDEGVLFAGDVVFQQCTPMGWIGSYEKWFQALDLIVQLAPKVIVPGHGPCCGVEGAVAMKDYLQYVRNESKKCFDEGMTSLEASKRIELGPYLDWRAPGRVYMNVERAYREFRGEPMNALWNAPAVFDALYEVANARGLKVEY